MHSPICFVVEIYEPYILRLNKKEIEYTEMTQEEIKTHPDVNQMKRKIVGTVSIRNHNSLHESAWLHKLCIDPEYPFNRIGKLLIENAMKHAFEHNMFTCETVSSECHEDYRELLLKIGFLIKQIYHKSIIGSSLRIMKVRKQIYTFFKSSFLKFCAISGSDGN